MKLLLGLVISLGFFCQSLSAQTLLTVDATGADGQNGAPGSGSGGSGYGRSGGKAGNAGRSTPGQAAGNIDFKVTEGSSQKGVVVIDGFVSRSGNRRNLKETVNFGNNGYIFLDARGGQGGSGGVGANGCNGQTGSRGSDATRYSSGTDGGPGGNGCDGGDGTPGSSGGDGGSIKVTVNHMDTHLLMLFQQKVTAGNGGAGGKNGEGGSGGAGGSGGSSYSWTESIRDGETCRESCSASSNGNGSYTNRCTTTCTPRYRTEYHSNPGGSSGSRGSDGRDGTGNISPGSRGQDGRFSIEVEGPNGIQTFRRRYDINLVSYHFRTQSGIDVYEPGSKVIVSKIKVKNSGEMPTPPNHNAMIYLNDNRWVLSKGQQIAVDKSIQPGETYELPGFLEFTIADTEISKPGDRFREEGTIRPLSYLADVNRPFDNFDNQRHFEVTFPVEITPISAPRSVEAGSSTRLFWRVKNISNSSFGQDSEVARKIQNLISLREDPLSQENGVLEFNGTKVKSGFLFDIARLAPGESTLIEGEVSIAPNTPYYSQVGLQLGLDLTKVNQKDQMKRIQVREFNIRVSKTYQPIKNTDLLLVTNNKTEPDEIQAWEKLAKELGLNIAVWDLSFYGFLDLTRQLHTDSSLQNDFYKKTIVVLNNDFESESGAMKAALLAARKSLVSAMNETGTGVYIVGGDKELVQDMILPPLGAERDNFKNQEDFHKALESVSSSGKERLFGPYVNFYDKIKYSDWYLFRKPTEADAQKEANKVLSDLQKRYPQMRFVVIYEFDPSENQKGRLKTQWNIGNLYVRRLGAAGTGNMIALAGDSQEVHRPRFIFSRENILSLFMSMRFSEKLAYLQRLMSFRGPLDLQAGSLRNYHPDVQLSDQQVLNQLVDSMISDLAYEQRLVQKHVGLDAFDLQWEIWNLRKLTRLVTPWWGSPETALGKSLVRLAAGIRFLLWSEAGVAKDAQADKYSRNLYERFVDVAFGRISHPLFPDNFRQASPQARALDLNINSKIPNTPKERIDRNKAFRKEIDTAFYLYKQFEYRNFKPGSWTGWLSSAQRREHRFSLLTNPMGVVGMSSLRNEVALSSEILPMAEQKKADERERSSEAARSTYEKEIKKEKQLLKFPIVEKVGERK